MSKWFEGIVADNRHWSNSLFSLRIHNAPLSFIPGQFISLALRIDNEIIARPYSLINSPERDEIECLLTAVKQGQLSEKLHQLTPGDTVLVSQKASGFFTLNEVRGEKTLWLIASGTGIGPYLSILQTDEPWYRFTRINLIHSVRYKQDLVYPSLIHKWTQGYAQQFQYQAIVTRDSVQGTLKKRLPLLIDNGEIERVFKDQMGQDCAIMLCGNPEMVADCMERFKGRGIKKNLRRKPGQVTVERYW